MTVHHLLTHTSGIELDDYLPYNEAALRAESSTTRLVPMNKSHVSDPVLQLPNFSRSSGYTIDIRVANGVRAIGHSGGARA